ncbi:NAD(P)-dependent oxidoreductase [Pseudomonas sp. Je.1.5.c]|jgi:nucleoside-diphosphate-sugar epimerase|uniref:NAD-dependent epimerase/dehydratase family protein n=1 Tax=Pseudomonas sp. Je.1.5.c TaxID=3142839 RepID=UPI003DAA0FA0
MNSLVIGSTSTLGKAIAQALSRHGPVKMAGRRQADVAFDLIHGAPADISDTFDVVVHAAADFGGNAPEDLIRAEQANSVGTLAACQLAERCGARQVILLSSRSAGYQPGDRYFGIYALSKRHAEEVASLYCTTRGMTLCILRLSQVYDSQALCRAHQPLLYAIADNAAAGNTVNLHGGNDARRSYLHLDDLAEICARVASGGIGGLYNCAHPQDPRLSEIALAAIAAFGQPGDVRFLADKDDIPDLPPFVCSQDLFEQIGYVPQIDIQRGFELMRIHRESDA